MNNLFPQFSNASYVDDVDDDDLESFDIDTYATIAEKFQCVRVRCCL